MKKQVAQTVSSDSVSEKMSLHPITWAFCSGQGHLEKPFMDDYFFASLPIVRFSCFFACLIFCIIGLVVIAIIIQYFFNL